MSSRNPKTALGGLVSMLLLFMAIFAVNIKLDDAVPENTAVLTSNPSASAYTSVDPIIIGGGLVWADYPFITGTGTDEDPYIIANVEITGGVENRTFEGDRSAFGIKIMGSISSFQIQNCKITNFHIGIFGETLTSSTSKIIQGNEISHCGIGINIYGENYTISSNIIEECHTAPENRLAMIYLLDHQGPYTYGGAGIWADFQGQNLEISYNTIRNCELGVMMPGPGSLQHNQLENCGVLFERTRIMSIIVENNTVNDLPLGFFVGEEDDIKLNGDEQQYGQLVIIGCQNVELSTFEIGQTTIGLWIVMNQNITITDITVEECIVGAIIEDISPFVPGSYKKLTIEGLAIRNCLTGVQLMVRDFHIPDTTYITDFAIDKAKDNEYDVLLSPGATRGINLTVPIGTSVCVDRYSWPIEVKVELDGVIYAKTENVTSLMSYHDETWNATLITFEEIGEYSVYSEKLIQYGDIIQREPFHNLTIIVVNSGFTIPGFSLGWFGWGIGIGCVIGLVSISKKQKIFGQTG